MQDSASNTGPIRVSLEAGGSMRGNDPTRWRLAPVRTEIPRAVRLPFSASAPFGALRPELRPDLHPEDQLANRLAAERLLRSRLQEMDELAAPERRPRPRAALWKRIALSLAVLVGLLALLEAYGRWTLGAQFVAGESRGPSWKDAAVFDSQMGWGNRPSARAHVYDGTLDYHVRINSAGWRDPERALVPAEGVRRVALLGDSIAWGWGVDDGERFSDLVEQRLGAGVEVLNFAVPGYGTDQEYWTLLERALAYRPDVVLLCFVLNDTVEAESTREYEMEKPCFRRRTPPSSDGLGGAGGGDGVLESEWVVVNRPVLDPRGALGRARADFARTLESHSGFVSLLARANSAPLPAPPPEHQGPRVTRPEALERIRQACDKLVDRDSATYMLLGRIRKLCDERGLTFVAFSVPHHHDQYLYDPLYLPQEPLTHEGAYRSRLSQRLAQAGAELGFQTFSVDQAMLDETAVGHVLHCGDGHLNVLGNQVVGRCVEPVLRAALDARASR